MQDKSVRAKELCAELVAIAKEVLAEAGITYELKTDIVAPGSTERKEVKQWYKEQSLAQSFVANYLWAQVECNGEMGTLQGQLKHWVELTNGGENCVGCQATIPGWQQEGYGHP